MKLIGILSDTHSCWDDRYAAHFTGCDEIWHAGDVGDIEIVRRLEAVAPVVRAVYGNIDHGTVRRALPDHVNFTVDGVNVWLSHIGGYPGRHAPGIRDILADRDIRLHVAGHSHILKVMPDRQLELLHVNPGAAGIYGWQKVRTLVRLTLDAGTVSNLEVIELSPGVVRND